MEKLAEIAQISTPIEKLKMKIGLWIPQRQDLSKSMTVDDPAHIDSRIYKLFLDFLDERKVDYVEGLDFRQAIISNHRVFIDHLCLSHLDHFVWMGVVDRSYDSYHLEVLKTLGYSTNVHNSYSFFNLATDKFSTFSFLHQYDIPVSELYLVNSENLNALKPLFEDSSFLLKPRRSSFGIGIVKLDSYEQFRDIAEYHQQSHYYLEKFYPNDLTEWTGVTVFNGVVLYGFRKQSSKLSGWKIYDKDKVGGAVDYIKPNAEIEAIALEIGKRMGANHFGLDFIKTESGYKVVDINCCPGIYYDFIEELNIPIAEYFFKMLPF